MVIIFCKASWLLPATTAVGWETVFVPCCQMSLSCARAWPKELSHWLCSQTFDCHLGQPMGVIAKLSAGLELGLNISMLCHKVQLKNRTWKVSGVKNVGWVWLGSKLVDWFRSQLTIIRLRTRGSWPLSSLEKTKAKKKPLQALQGMEIFNIPSSHIFWAKKGSWHMKKRIWLPRP